MNRPQKPVKSSEGDHRHTALGDSLKARGYAASPAAASSPAATPGPLDLSKQGKIVVRRERKGRGGKTVTIISGLDRPAPQLAEIARAMRKALGCGSTVEEGTIILQGEIVPRAQAWLRARGARTIVIGS